MIAVVFLCLELMPYDKSASITCDTFHERHCFVIFAVEKQLEKKSRKPTLIHNHIINNDIEKQPVFEFFSLFSLLLACLPFFCWFKRKIVDTLLMRHQTIEWMPFFSCATFQSLNVWQSKWTSNGNAAVFYRTNEHQLSCACVYTNQMSKTNYVNESRIRIKWGKFSFVFFGYWDRVRGFCL